MRRSLVRRTVFGLATAACITLHIMTTNRWIFALDRPGFYAMCGRGTISADILKSSRTRSPGFFAIRPKQDYPTIWRPYYTRSGSRTGVLLPLWMPASLTAAAAILPLRRRTRAGCPSCGYDLHGLAHGPCPECGGTKAKAAEP